ncbi:phosphatase PAP2/dual specificity phosphatase family protein [Methylovirgula sp. 4M-Z18]|uniref:phosphatase PAP2/dual specificity phosphatase family protein n=1 Tax=Methylovirgula sp. 4M-Z18 TaxID=2293567 RepID=UPI000E2E5701|nr:phosphatase PAP2/dual specificity phosphatase family protein [Methylovirgula sp. 4M-Z18]RFB81211.1 PAP2 phosphatase family protein [Methylovirgula sp. 4M-Z18]
MPRIFGERPLGRAILYLAVLGTFFYASYGFANEWTAAKSDVPSIVFDWERRVPFLAWTIIPYWTTNAFYAASLLLCRTRQELDCHAKRLLVVQIIAIACFLAFPLKFSWDRPETTGLEGYLFDALGQVDKPFNEAPSLHVALTVILWDFYHKILPRAGLPVFAALSVLVIVSVMTTFQHHFIDIPTGLLLGFFCIWLFPDSGRSPFAAARLTHEPGRLKLAGCYLLAAGVCVSLASAFGGTALWLWWPAFAFASVALAYVWLGPALFQKSEDGIIHYSVRWMLAPYLAGARLNSRLWTRRDHACVEVTPAVFLGRFPSRADAARFARVIDLTAELSRPPYAGLWRSTPLLDLVAPDIAALRGAADSIAQAAPSDTVLVCCALGYGRSAAAVAVWLVRSGYAANVEAALQSLAQVRPRIAVKAPQRARIEEAVRG